MPKYKYHCANCGETMTKIERVVPSEFTECPECGERMERQKVSSFSSRYKGSGFYSTDYGGRDD